MPFDALTMAAVADEVDTLARGGRIQKIIQPSAVTVALSLYHEGSQRWLALSADTQTARVSFVADRLAKGFPTPSAFVMLLRKHLEGMRLAEVRQAPMERVLILSCQGGDRTVRLVSEVMGRHSNVILVDDSDRVLGAVKVVPASQSRVRPIIPGQLYRPPPERARDDAIFPPGRRVDPAAEPASCRALLSDASPDRPARDALLGLLPGASPFLVEQILARASTPPTSTLAEADVDQLLASCVQLYQLYQTRQWHPCTFTDRRGRPDFAPFLPLLVENVQEEASMSAAVDRRLGTRESHDALKAARDALLSEVSKQQRGIARKSASLREGLKASGQAESAMQQGQLILAYQYMVEPGTSELIIPDLDVSIPLDPRFTPAENAERLFRRYRKLRDAERKLPALLAATEAEAARLEDLAVFARLATSESELRELSRDLAPQREQKEEKKGGRDRRRGPLRFSHGGYTAIVGRNARENEEVTFRLARRTDLWLHARQRTGAHVVVPADGSSVPEDVVEAAAQLAAYFSEGRQDSAVDIDVTQVRNVRKIPGGPPGRVTYQHFRTLRVEPSIDSWTQV